MKYVYYITPWLGSLDRSEFLLRVLLQSRLTYMLNVLLIGIFRLKGKVEVEQRKLPTHLAPSPLDTFLRDTRILPSVVSEKHCKAAKHPELRALNRACTRFQRSQRVIESGLRLLSFVSGFGRSHHSYWYVRQRRGVNERIQYRIVTPHFG